jgi:hypothetical protein
VEIFREAGIQYEEALSLYELARLCCGESDTDRAATALDRSIELFQTVGASYDLQQAEGIKQTLTP